MIRKFNLLISFMNWFSPMIIFFTDPRTENWLFVKSPTPIISLIVAYLYIVRKGPKLMENNKPLSMKYLLMFYNFCLVCLSAYMFVEVSEFHVTGAVVGKQHDICLWMNIYHVFPDIVLCGCRCPSSVTWLVIVLSVNSSITHMILWLSE